MRVLAMDPGVTNIGWAVLDVNDYPYGGAAIDLIDCGMLKCKVDDKDSFNTKILKEMKQTLWHFAEKMSYYTPDHMAWEIPPSFGGMGQQSRIMATASVFITLALQSGVKTCAMTPNHMKKQFVGDGKADKETVIEEVIKRYPSLERSWFNEATGRMNKHTPDRYDAVAIATVAIEENKWEGIEWEIKVGSTLETSPLD